MTFLLNNFPRKSTLDINCHQHPWHCQDRMAHCALRITTDSSFPRSLVSTTIYSTAAAEWSRAETASARLQTVPAHWEPLEDGTHCLHTPYPTAVSFSPPIHQPAQVMSHPLGPYQHPAPECSSAPLPPQLYYIGHPVLQ
ncbi:hypothetical protein BDV29DRAFT_79009 [Aspergillus leporis]|uniref:Uncharacterized protein n=1 Tax=Aspergillus leporis TaxID=41062 RepID=A0A5N5WLG2_9EURO|nr:hypothetical protein BDV29DRAFT_79009 [Aspergillus leporis]